MSKSKRWVYKQRLILMGKKRFLESFFFFFLLRASKLQTMKNVIDFAATRSRWTVNNDSMMRWFNCWNFYHRLFARWLFFWLSRALAISSSHESNVNSTRATLMVISRRAPIGRGRGAAKKQKSCEIFRTTTQVTERNWDQKKRTKCRRRKQKQQLRWHSMPDARDEDERWQHNYHLSPIWDDENALYGSWQSWFLLLIK